MSGIENLDAFLQYDCTKSAKETRKVLAVINRKEKGRQYEVMTIVDLKTVGVIGKIILWWNGSLKKEKVGSFVNRNLHLWSTEVEKSHDLQVVFEKQSVKLSRKIPFENRATWKLKIKVHYSFSKFGSMLNVEKEIPFDRLTTHSDLSQKIENTYFFISPPGHYRESFWANLLIVFKKRVYSGDYQGGKDFSIFLKDTDKGANRSCEIHLSEHDEKILDLQYEESMKEKSERKQKREDDLFEFGRQVGLMQARYR